MSILQIEKLSFFYRKVIVIATIPRVIATIPRVIATI